MQDNRPGRGPLAEAACEKESSQEPVKTGRVLCQEQLSGF